LPIATHSKGLMPQVIRLLFFGDRRIGMECLGHLSRMEISGQLEVAGIVSTEKFYSTAITNYTNFREKPFINSVHRNEPQILDLLSETCCDFIISVQHPWKLSSLILKKVNFQAFNLHNAELPDYKGFNSISHTLLEKRLHHTSTIHWINAEIDKGEIAYTAKTSISPHDDAMSLYEASLDGATNVFHRLIDDLINSIIPPRKPQKSHGSFFSRNALAAEKNCTNKNTDESISVARACFFPPHEPAYIEDKSGKVYLIPESHWKGIVPLLGHPNSEVVHERMNKTPDKGVPDLHD
jgi:methionyl-tRNA formyltransferase